MEILEKNNMVTAKKGFDSLVCEQPGDDQSV